MRILVGGCAGDIGISVSKILKKQSDIDFLMGADIHGDHPGEVFFDKCIVLPRATDPLFVPRLFDVLKECRIDFYFPTSEAELKCLLESGLKDTVGDTTLICPSERALKLGLDKLATAQFLKDASLPYPETHKVGSFIPELPVIFKARASQGSKNVEVVRSRERALELNLLGEDFVWQELLLPNDEEYTCGLFGSSTGDIRSIVFRRVLHGGLTGRGILVENPDIDQLLVRIAKGLNLVGSINVQLRLTSKGPIVFEINPRFSSTVFFRHLMGFDDVIWSLQQARHMQISAYVAPKGKVRFFRVAGEVVIGM